MKSPDALKADAARDRDRAAELADTNPAAADYYERRADWREHLARQEEAARADG